MTEHFDKGDLDGTKFSSVRRPPFFWMLVGDVFSVKGETYEVIKEPPGDTRPRVHLRNVRTGRESYTYLNKLQSSQVRMVKHGIRRESV